MNPKQRAELDMSYDFWIGIAAGSLITAITTAVLNVLIDR